jgi:hypothetical protein
VTAESAVLDQIINIELFGQAYTFKASSKVARPQEIADFVSRQVEQARTAAEGANKFDALILAVLSIANEYFEMRRSRQDLVTDIDERCRVLIDHLDANM